MSEVLDKIMTFINENTYILIGICIFLILVLIGYLIDNSIKSKKIRKEIKNEDKTLENINSNIINEKVDNNMDESFNVMEENKEEIDQGIKFDLENDLKKDIDMQLNLDEVNENNNIDDALNLGSFNDSLELNDNNKPLSLDLDIDNIDNNGIVDTELKPDITLDLDIPSETTLGVTDNVNVLSENILVDNVEVNSANIFDTDPDGYTLEKPASEYKNNKKLSEILSNVDNSSKTKPVSEEIFDNSKKDIVINPNVKKEEVEIEKVSSPSDELDRIMQKLSKIDLNDEEDNYTNIF